MSLYGHKLIEEAYADDELEGIDLQPYIELAAIYDISRGSDEQIQEFCNSELANVLQERKVLSTKSIQKINLKQKDLKTRIKLMAYQLAASKNDKDYIKMKKYRDLWKMHRANVIKKYGAKASKLAAVAQREYIKAARKESDKPADK